MAANRVTTKKPAARRPRFETAADLLASLGGIPPVRVRLDPLPGTATERDLLRAIARTGRLMELVDGTLVEKPMGSPEAYVALELGFHIRSFLATHDLGYATTADDLIRVAPGQVRGPDVTFTSWLNRPERTVPRKPVSVTKPTLAVEVLSPSNTPAEMARKIGEYFGGGCRLVWVIDPRTETAVAYTAADTAVAVPASGVLDGGDVLPGFRLPLAKLFERLEKPEPKKKRKNK
ncbi:MAG: Uma2 family endonuclease [Gemmataceae bacterium]|nr:Uma2 family endonuclease [Gemmataceae bacterium]